MKGKHMTTAKDNYTRNITFAKVHKNPLYMRILKILIDNPNGIRRNEVLKITHGYVLDKVPVGWMIGPFNCLSFYGYATYERRGNQCFWRATPKGEAFYNVNCVKHDLLAA